MKKYRLTIIVATFNSGITLPKVLGSIDRQTLSRNQIEVLLVDGGSTDNTILVAKKNKCKVIENTKVVPAWGKYLGFLQAKGDYVMFLDSDEVIENKNSLIKKIKVLDKNDTVYAVTGSGYKTPDNFSFLNKYVNEFGDPFSFFYYRLSKDNRFFIKTIKNRYSILTENYEYLIVNFNKVKFLPIFELVAMGSIIKANYFKKEFPEIVKRPGLIPHLFNLLVSKDGNIAIVKHDALIHYSVNTFKKYLGKIRSRIINNIFTSAEEGFMGRNKLQPHHIRLKKYLFFPYVLTLVGPLIDSLYLCLTRRDIRFLMHIPLCIYTIILIIYFKTLKSLHIYPVLKSYGQEQEITI